MTEQPRFQSPSNGNQPLSEAQRALELETHLPLTGWQQEVVDTLPSSLRCDWRFLLHREMLLMQAPRSLIFSPQA